MAKLRTEDLLRRAKYWQSETKTRVQDAKNHLESFDFLKARVKLASAESAIGELSIVLMELDGIAVDW